MNILINFSTLKSGGGLNVAMNFLHTIFDMKIDNVNFFFFVANESSAHIYLKKIGYENFYVVPSSPIKRIIFELFLSKKILINHKIDIIYSYFGIGLFFNKIPQVSGSADSNLYFPEIDFWSHYRGISRIKKKIVDLYRVYGLKRATAVVFENKIMEERSHKIFNLKNTKYIKPSINFDFENEELEFNLTKESPKALFLCGWQLNKNIMMIPKVARLLKDKEQTFTFIITANRDDSDEYKQFIQEVNNNDVSEMIEIIGSVKKEQLKSLFNQIDYIFLLSKLESFSNNIIESWYFTKPLIIANELWSKSICKNAVFYVNRDNANEISNLLINLCNDKSKIEEIVKNGKMELKNYPLIKERIEEEVRYLTYVFKNH